MSFGRLSASRPISTPVCPCPIAPPGPAKSTFSPKAALSLSVLSRDSPSVAWLLRLNTTSKRTSAYATPRWARRKRRSAGSPASLRNPIASKMSFDAIAQLVEPPRNHILARRTRRASQRRLFRWPAPSLLCCDRYSLQTRLTQIGAPALLQNRILEWIGLPPRSERVMRAKPENFRSLCPRAVIPAQLNIENGQEHVGSRLVG